MTTPIPLDKTSSDLPKRLISKVSKNYERWLQHINDQFERDERTKGSRDKNLTQGKISEPIFDYSLLEELEKASNEFSNKLDLLKKLDPEKVLPSNSSKNLAPDKTNIVSLKHKKAHHFSDKTLNHFEIEILRDKIYDMIKSENLGDNPVQRYSTEDGFSLYGTKDEEGLYHENANSCSDNDNDDNEVEPHLGDRCPIFPNSQHHIELELSSCACCDHSDSDHGSAHYGDDNDAIEGNGPSCDFTFEYDHKGNLISSYDNVEKNLRLLNIASNNEKSAKAEHSTPVQMRKPIDQGLRRSDRKNKNKKKDKIESKSYSGLFQPCCLFCEYEAIFGSKPRQLIKIYDAKIKKEQKRRNEFKMKLDHSKRKALERQRRLKELDEHHLHPN
ncbi:uncharacterized protein PRCAT00001503001 [Priceomyces carsonii]|uniref:uncharacterized protein n=1 Tax=Priceomyces carsonii TaxID=28549 RepID=UPI002EDBB22E|nr:unnamed protein product [Priceomyces carsonii]